LACANRNRPLTFCLCALLLLLSVRLPPLNSRPNLIGQAHHGSGKTATFSLGVLSRINLAQKSTQAIVLCPTRELAIQVCEVLRSLAQYTTVEIAAAVPTERGAAKTKLTAQVVVGTPGTIDAKIAHRELDIRSVHMFVADEADQMIAQDGMREKTVQIKKKLPRNTQILLFSATFDEDTRKFAKVVAPQAVEIMVKTEELSLDGIKQYFMDARDEADKYKALTDIFSLLSIGQSIIFVHVRFHMRNTIAMASALCCARARFSALVLFLTPFTCSLSRPWPRCLLYFLFLFLFLSDRRYRQAACESDARGRLHGVPAARKGHVADGARPVRPRDSRSGLRGRARSWPVASAPVAHWSHSALFLFLFFLCLCLIQRDV
jgi:hypothetical protein